MIELTPLDVRKKRGDFGKTLRGYDPEEVDAFLELVTERMEVLVKENLTIGEERDRLKEKVVVQEKREQAIQDALVTAQELRQDVKKQAQREAQVMEREARARIEAMIAESGKVLTEHRGALQELERQRDRFLKAFRTFLERELDTVEVEAGRAPLEDVTLDLDLGKVVWPIGEDRDDDDEDADEIEDEDEDESRIEDEVEIEDVSKVEGVSEVEDEGEYLFSSDSAEAAEPTIASDGPTQPESGSGEAGEGVMEPGPEERRAPAESGEDESLWLSSIVSDREDEDAD